MNLNHAQEALSQAKNYYHKIKDINYPADLKPSDLWLENLRERLQPNLVNNNSLELFHSIIESDFFTYGRKVKNFLYAPVNYAFSSYFKKQASAQALNDLFLQESSLCSPKMSEVVSGKAKSHTFLWHFSIYDKIVRQIDCSKLQILELGGGYGGLARVFKLGKPGVTYWILDLHESLFYSLFYLKCNFPNARFALVSNQKELEQAFSERHNLDFVFVPMGLTEQFSRITKPDFDLLINTASLGEMQQNAVNCYLELIQNTLNVKYFYSVNRFCDPYAQCDCSTPLDSLWKIHLWKLYGEDSYTQIDPAWPLYLEFFAERISKEVFQDSYREFISQNCLQSANRILKRRKFHPAAWPYIILNCLLLSPKRIPSRVLSYSNNSLLSRICRKLTTIYPYFAVWFYSSKWVYLMWESVRLHPNQDNLPVYLNYLQNQKARECNYYIELASKLKIKVK